MTATITENTIAVPAPQNASTVRNLRLGVGLIGTLLPVMLIAGNLIMGDKTIIPSSMSSSYYTSTRNLFVGSLCALGVFLVGYRGYSSLQDLCTSFAGVCALLVAFAPTAPASPGTEPAWVNYLHHIAATFLIFTLGMFCLICFTQFPKPGGMQPKSTTDRLRALVRRFTAWANSAWSSLKHPGTSTLYLVCGILVLVSGGFALYTGVWPTSWSTGWQSLYAFEAVAVFAFGAAWLAEPVKMIWPSVKMIWPW